MEGESNGMEGSRQCQAGCGYFGSPATDGLCSLCYKEVVKKKQQPPQGSLVKVPSTQQQQLQRQPLSPQHPPEEETTVKVDRNSPCPSAAAGLTAPVASTPQSSLIAEGPSGSDSKKKSNRCLTCRKKVGLTGFECRCGGLFCATHRYSDKHECSFDYRQLGAEEIRKNNPVVVSEKINKI